MLEKIKALFGCLFKKGEPLEMSYSKISAYRFCPWKYKLVYDDGLRVPPNPYISLGLSIHKTLEEYHKAKRHDLDGLFEFYNQVWVNEGFSNAQQTQHFYDKGKKMLEQYFKFSQDRKSEIVAVEKEFSFPVGRRMLRGIIDRIDRLPDGTYEVIDYKTHSEMWEQPRIDADLQLTFYAMGCKNVLGIEPSTLSYFFLAHNKVVSTRRTKAQQEEALKTLEETAKKIEKKQYPPETSMCQRCDFRLTCQFSIAKNPPPQKATAQ